MTGKLFAMMLRIYFSLIEMPSEYVIDCSRLIKQHQFTIAFAESATAGRMASEFSLTQDWGRILLGGIVCYDAFLKETILGIDPAIISNYTPESQEVTQELATRLALLIASGIQVAVTGLTGPGGSESKQKPVGTIFICILIRGHSYATCKVFGGPAQYIMRRAADLAPQNILDALHDDFR